MGRGCPRGVRNTHRTWAGARVPGLGPAFFTKVLYFVGGEELQVRGAVRCRILDARVVGSLRSSGWESLPKGNYNWFADTYVSYCELSARWAGELSVDIGRSVEADEIERVLFDGRS
ncbi:8-oxoguanine DNA glycosylase OGG fold protein [Oerskovia turbata]